MKILLIILIWFNLFNYSFAQKPKKIIEFAEGDSTSWNYWMKQDVKELKLRKLWDVYSETNIRISNEWFIIELSQNKLNQYIGSLFIRFEKINKNNEFIKLVYQQKKLESNLVKSLMEDLQKLDIMILPDYNEIKDYAFGLHGVLYGFEVNDDRKFRFYTYWSPEWTQQNPDIPEVQKVRKILNILEQKLKLFEELNRFQSNLPNGKYRRGLMEITNER